MCGYQKPPNEGNVTCTDGQKTGSICKYTCETYFLLNDPSLNQTMCADFPGDPFRAEWTNDEPLCLGN